MNNLTPSFVIPKSENFAEPSNRYKNYANNKDYDYKSRRDNYSFLCRNSFIANTKLILSLEPVYKEVFL